MEFYVTCRPGFESLLASELKELGLPRVRQLIRRVSFGGELSDALRACMWSRLGTGINLVIKRFDCATLDDLYREAYRIPWEDVLRPHRKIEVSARGASDRLGDNGANAHTVMDALGDRLADARGENLAIDFENPDARLVVSAGKNGITLSLLLAFGPAPYSSRHKALFAPAKAPAATGAADPVASLWPDLTASLLLRSGWAALTGALGETARNDASADPRKPLLVSINGGTAALEAARMLAGRAPGKAATYHGFKSLAAYSPQTWTDLEQEADLFALDAPRHASALVVCEPDDASLAWTRSLLQAEGLDRLATFVPARAKNLRGALKRFAGSGDWRGIIAVDASRTRLEETPALLGLVSQVAHQLAPLHPTIEALALDTSLERVLGGAPASIETLPLRGDNAKLMRFEPAEAPSPLPEIDLGDGSPVPVLIPESDQFANRLKKDARLRRKWARREGVSCYRVYDADLPDYACAIDLYTGADATPGRWLMISEYAAPKTVDAGLARERMLDILSVAPRVLGVDPAHVHARARTRSRGGSQYGKRDVRHGNTGERAERAAAREQASAFDALPRIDEGGLTFAVNLDDYLDTGIFLDHRVTRGLVRKKACEARFLNLFAYTGTATCYAAAGGAESTTTVDLSNTYLAWARFNMGLNGFADGRHEFVRADVLSWIDRAQRGHDRWDLIFCDPPTFSNSAKMGSRTFDVQRDHVELLSGVANLLAPGGEAVFSCNLRSFRPDVRALEQRGIDILDITDETIPEDFQRNRRIHCCYIVTRREDARM